MAKKTKRSTVRKQYGAVPYRITPANGTEVMLITTRETGRWMVPKGWPIKKLGPLGTALLEAREEAGIIGDGVDAAIGEFRYLKIMRHGPHQLCDVELFPMAVTQELAEWPEMHERERRWFTHSAAAEAVVEEPLRVVLAELPKRLERVG